MVAGTRPVVAKEALRSQSQREIQELPLPLLSLQAAYEIADEIFEHAQWWRCNVSIRAHILLAGGHPRTLLAHLIALKKHPSRYLYPIDRYPIAQSLDVLAHLLMGRLGKFTHLEVTMFIDRGFLAPMQPEGAFFIYLFIL